MKGRANEVDSYLAEVPPEHRDLLQKLRERISKAAPQATETISYQIPTFKYRGRSLLHFASFKDHCSLYPCTEGMLAVGGDDLVARRTGKGTIQFTVDNPLPAALVSKIVKARLEEIDAGGR